jgi:hypothetical protein
MPVFTISEIAGFSLALAINTLGGMSTTISSGFREAATQISLRKFHDGGSLGFKGVNLIRRASFAASNGSSLRRRRGQDRSHGERVHGYIQVAVKAGEFNGASSIGCASVRSPHPSDGSTFPW